MSGTQEIHNGATPSASLDMRSLRWWEMAKATNSGVRRQPAVLSGRVAVHIALMRCENELLGIPLVSSVSTDTLVLPNATHPWGFHMNEKNHTDTKLAARSRTMRPRSYVAPVERNMYGAYHPFAPVPDRFA